MRLCVNDGVAIFATNLIKCNPEGVRENLAPFQLELDGIILYPYDNLATAEDILKQLNIPYTVEVLTHDPLHIQKAQGVKYASRTECVNHLLNDDEPESQVIPNLKKKLADEKIRNDKLEERLLKLEKKGMV